MGKRPRLLLVDDDTEQENIQVLHDDEEVIKTNRSEQLMAREGLLFWRPL